MTKIRASCSGASGPKPEGNRKLLLRNWIGAWTVVVVAFLAAKFPAESLVSVFCVGAGSEPFIFLGVPLIAFFFAGLLWVFVCPETTGISKAQILLPLILLSVFWAILVKIPHGVSDQYRVEYTIERMKELNGSGNAAIVSNGRDGWGNPLVMETIAGRRFIISYGRCGKRDFETPLDYASHPYQDACDDIVLMNGALVRGPTFRTEETTNDVSTFTGSRSDD